MDHVEEIRARLDCRELAEGYGVKIRNRTGSWYMASCFNAEAHAHGDRNPSLSLGPQGYKCFSINCAISGDVFDLIAFFEGLDVREQFGEVLAIAAEHAGVDLDAMREQSASFAPTAHHRRKDPAMRKVARAVRGDQARLEKLREKLPSRAQHQPPPLLKSHLEVDLKEDFTLDPDHPRLELMARVWDIVKYAPLGPGALSWLESRGIDPDIAYAYGVRDWSVEAEQLRAFFDAQDLEVLEASGLIRATGEDEWKTWVGLRALEGERWARGVAVPVIHPDWTRAPIAWRWRLTEPVETKRGGKLKALAQYSGIPSVPMIPLGVAPPSANVLHNLARWPHLTPDPQAPQYVVLLCEGEPDWLSLAEVSAKMETPLYLVPVGIVAMSQGFPPEHLWLLEGALRVVCMMDEGTSPKKKGGAQDMRTGGKRVVDGIMGMLLEKARAQGLGFDEAFEKNQKKLIVALQPDNQDVNDLHLRGTLPNLLADLLGDVL